MNIEVVEFYFLHRNDEKQEYNGTLHIYLTDYKIDLRGIFFHKKKKCLIMRFPNRAAIDPDTKKTVHYPIFHFTESDLQKKLWDKTYLLGKEYIEKNYFPKNKEVKQTTTG